MTPEAQLALINNIVPIITALVSLVGAIAAFLGYRKSAANSHAIAANDVKTDEVGKAVNGRMTAFIEEIERKNAEKLGEAVKAARLEVEKVALAHITDLKAQIALARSDYDIAVAVDAMQTKLLGPQ
jgi:hypothetical protein